MVGFDVPEECTLNSSYDGLLVPNTTSPDWSISKASFCKESSLKYRQNLIGQFQKPRFARNQI